MSKMGGDPPPAKAKPAGVAAAAPARSTLGPGSTAQLAPTPAADPAAAAQPAAAAAGGAAKANQDAKVKDFYKGLLNKKKATGVPTPSNKAGAGDLIPDEQIQPKDKE